MMNFLAEFDNVLIYSKLILKLAKKGGIEDFIFSEKVRRRKKKSKVQWIMKIN